jgi:hypothetical protein
MFGNIHLSGFVTVTKLFGYNSLVKVTTAFCFNNQRFWL